MAGLFRRLSFVCIVVVAFLHVSFGLQRRIDEVEDAVDGGSSSYFAYSLADFSIRFEKCQFVKMYDDTLAQDPDSTSPLAVKHFVVFKLCDDCSTCTVYGSYVLEVDEYLSYTIANQKQALVTTCQNCNRDGGACDGENNANCNNDESCSQLCDQYENLAANGMIDAAEYATCQLWQQPNNNNNADGGGDDQPEQQPQYYIGPRCNAGHSIEIGVYSDANCWEPVDSVNIEDLLGAKLSYHLLQHTYYSSSSSSSSTANNNKVCLSCMEGSYDADAAMDASDGDNVNEMCENLYDGAAKCESRTGLAGGFVQVHRDDGKYENQVENEFMACTFINSLVWDSYTERGEINWKAKQDAIVRNITTQQGSVLSILAVAFFVLFGLWYYYEKKIHQIETNPPIVDPKTGSYIT